MTEIPLTGFVPATVMPTDATAFTTAMLNEMIAPWHPDIRITQIRILENKAYGDGMVSTAARAVLDVDYAEGAPAGLPQRVILKLGRSPDRSEEHTSELQSLMRISYAVFCLKKKHNKPQPTIIHISNIT